MSLGRLTVRLGRLFVGIISMLLGTGSVALTVRLCCGLVRLSSLLVMIGCFGMGLFCHRLSPGASICAMARTRAVAFPFLSTALRLGSGDIVAVRPA